MIDLDLLTYEAAQIHLFLSEFGLHNSRLLLWREAPPGVVGIKAWLRHAKLARPVEKWFVQRRQPLKAEEIKFRLFTATSGALGRLSGRRMPKREHVHSNDAFPVAQWLARQSSAGIETLVDTNPTMGARICLAAQEANLDISGSFFRFSAEPYTRAKAELVRKSGCRAASFYSAAEIGHIGLACGNPEHVDEVHLMTDKVAMIQRRRRVGDSRLTADSFLFTTLLPSCPRLALNVELGDYGVASERRCGCLLDRMGFRFHLHDIRSFEKLTGSGVTFLGSQLLDLVEEVLPRRFGGNPTDYQFLEREGADGIVRVFLVVSPRVKNVDEQEIVETTLSELSGVHGGAMMADLWRAGSTLRILRREPYITGALKLLPLHILGDGDETPCDDSGLG